MQGVCRGYAGGWGEGGGWRVVRTPGGRSVNMSRVCLSTFINTVPT